MFIYKASKQSKMTGEKVALFYASQFPTGHFNNSEPQGHEISEFYVVWKRCSTKDYEAPKFERVGRVKC